MWKKKKTWRLGWKARENRASRMRNCGNGQGRKEMEKLLAEEVSFLRWRSCWRRPGGTRRHNNRIDSDLEKASRRAAAAASDTKHGQTAWRPPVSFVPAPASRRPPRYVHRPDRPRPTDRRALSSVPFLTDLRFRSNSPPVFLPRKKKKKNARSSTFLCFFNFNRDLNNGEKILEETSDALENRVGNTYCSALKHWIDVRSLTFRSVRSDDGVSPFFLARLWH